MCIQIFIKKDRIAKQQVTTDNFLLKIIGYNVKILEYE